jgi:nicotinamidase-related amidase
MAANLGFEVMLLSDGTATFDRVSYNGKHYTAEAIHESALASLHQEFATVVSVSEVIEKSR